MMLIRLSCASFVALLFQTVVGQNVSSSITNPVTSKKVELRLKATLVGHKRASRYFGGAIAFSPDGQLVATSVTDDETLLWDTKTGQLQSRLKGELLVQDSISYVRKIFAFSPDGRALITVRGKTFYVWEVATGRLTAVLTGHKKRISTASFSPDSSLLATGSFDGTAKLWDSGTGKLKFTLVVQRKLPRYRVLSRLSRGFDRLTKGGVDVFFGPDGRVILTTYETSAAMLWDVGTGLLKAKLEHPEDAISSDWQEEIQHAWFSPNGEFIATEDFVTVALWETETGKLVNTFARVSCFAAFSPDGKLIGIVGKESRTKGSSEKGFYNISTGKLVVPIDVNAGCSETWVINQMTFSPDGRTLATATGPEYELKLWDFSTGRLKANQPLKSRTDWDVISESFSDIERFSFDASGSLLVSFTDNAVRLRNGETGDVIKTIDEACRPTGFSPDGKLLLSLKRDKKTFMLWGVVRPE